RFIRQHPRSTIFPYTPLFRSEGERARVARRRLHGTREMDGRVGNAPPPHTGLRLGDRSPRLARHRAGRSDRHELLYGKLSRIGKIGRAHVRTPVTWPTRTPSS